MKIIQYLLIILLSVSCKSKQVTTDIQKESTTEKAREVKTVYDTVYLEKEVIKTLPVYSETIIDTPCDSLGNIRPINTTIGSGGNRASIKTVNGQLVIQQYIDSTKQINQELKQVRFTLDSVMQVNSSLIENKQTSEIIRYVYPWDYYAVMAAAILFFFLWASKYVIRVYRWFNPLV